TYAEPAVALARRAMRHGDRDVAQTLLVATAHQAMATHGRAGAVPLQRELGRIFAAAGERAAAAEAYRGLRPVVPDPVDRPAAAGDGRQGPDRRGRPPRDRTPPRRAAGAIAAAAAVGPPARPARRRIPRAQLRPRLPRDRAAPRRALSARAPRRRADSLRPPR